MKKFLLSAAVVAMTAISAQALDLPLDDLPTGWYSSYDAATKTITYEEAWGGKGWWLDDVDYSQYTDVVIEVAPLTIQAKIVCEYQGDVASSEAGMFNLGETVLTCKLSEEGKAHTKQIYIQCGSLTDAPTITLVSAKLVDNSGVAPDLVIWTGEQQIDWWENAVTLAPSKFEGLEVGDDLAIDYAVNGETGVIKPLEVFADWTNSLLPSFAALPEVSAEYGTLYLGSLGASGTFKLTMNDEDVAVLKNPSNIQFMITGDCVTVTKVEIVKPSGINDIVAPAKGDGQMYNLMGVPVDNNYKGIVIKDGKKYYNR